jgi:uncharacterized membrane protein
MFCRLFASSTLLAAALFSTQASAGFNVCNKSKESRIVLAYAYEDRDKGWASTGWLDIQKGSCVTIVNGPLMERYQYIYVEVPGGYHWLDDSGDKVFFCTDSKKHFTIYNGDVPNGCEGSGYATTQFMKIDAGTLQNFEEDIAN